MLNQENPNKYRRLHKLIALPAILINFTMLVCCVIVVAVLAALMYLVGVVMSLFQYIIEALADGTSALISMVRNPTAQKCDQHVSQLNGERTSSSHADRS